MTLDPLPPQSSAVGDAIRMEARTLLKGLRLPETDPLPDDLKVAIRDLVRAHCQAYRIPQSTLANAIGIKESTVSSALNGNYKADDSAVLRKMNGWLDDDEFRRKRDAPLGVYDTKVLLSIRDAATVAKRQARTSDVRSVHAERARIVMAIGPSGIGKSAGGQAVAVDDPNSIFIRVTQRQGTDSALARLIVEAAGFRDLMSGSLRGALAPHVQRRLTHTGRLLIVDEAHRLAQSGYEYLRDLADVAGIPILLLGTQKMTNRLNNTRAGHGAVLDEQFSSRVAFVVDLMRGTDGNGGSSRPIFSIEEIVAIFRRDKIRLTPDGADYLQAIACMIGAGMLRQAANIFDIAAKAAKRGNGVVDRPLVFDAAQQVLVPAGLANTEIFRRIDNQIAENRKLEERGGKRAEAAG